MKAPFRNQALVWAIAWPGLVGLLLVSCGTFEGMVLAPPQIEGATFVGNAACVTCHTNIARQFPDSPHGRFYRDDLEHAAYAGCESCHGPGSRHVAAGGGREVFIVNPREEPDACFRCHVQAQAEFHLPYHHPVVEGRLGCVSCHDPHGPDLMKPAGGLAMARLNQNCSGCHREQSRPFVFEHEALREGCTICHQPHGAIQPKLLVDRDANLCLRCHSQVQTMSGQIVIGKEDHTFFLQTGTCYSAGCHTAVHGSNVNPKLRY